MVISRATNYPFVTLQNNNEVMATYQNHIDYLTEVGTTIFDATGQILIKGLHPVAILSLILAIVILKEQARIH